MTHIDHDQPPPLTPSATAVPAVTDQGLRTFMLGVYAKVAGGLVVSGAVAWATSHAPLVSYLFRFTPDGRLTGYTLAGMILMFAPLAILLGASFFTAKATPRSAGLLYWVLVSLLGASLGAIVLVYTATSIATTFFITAAAFGALSLYGYATKRDLGPIASFLVIGLVGLILALIVNMFLRSAMVSFVVSIIGVLVFAGLTAADTQKLKMRYHELGGDTAALGVATNYGALGLYLDFLNLFQFLLMLTGSRR